MNTRSHDDIRELLGAFALDAVDPDEAATVEAHLGTCPRCRDEVREHREVAALLAYAGTSAPEGMWDRLAANLEAAPPALAAPALGRGEDSTPIHAGGRRRQGRIAAAVAAAAVVVGLGAGGLQVQSALRTQRAEINALAQALAVESRDRLGEEAAAAALTPGARQVHLLSPDRVPVADAVLLADGTGYLVHAGAPSLPEGKTYQLWAVAGGKKLSLGIPGPAFSVVAFRAPPSTTDALALTVEDGDGVEVSQNQAFAFGLVRS